MGATLHKREKNGIAPMGRSYGHMGFPPSRA